MYTSQELKNLNDSELHLELQKGRLELHKIRLTVKTKELKAHHKLKEIKRYIARILTILKEKNKK